MNFVFLAPPLTGHWKPMAALARELTARGHRTSFVHHESAAPLAASLGVPFVPLGSGALAAHGGVAGTVREMARQTDMLCRHAPRLVREIGADAIVADQLEAAGGLIAGHLGLPFASVACALPINREAGVPPPYVGWPYDPSARGLWRNRGGWRIADLLMRPLGTVIQRWAAAWSLPGRRRLEDCFSPVLQIAQAVGGLDFPRGELPSSFHYVGPLRGRAEAAPALPERFVYCSLGTLQGGRSRLFGKVSAACGKLGLQLVLTHGGRLRPDQAARLPGTPLAFDSLPQEAVLAKAALVVTHAGFNTVLETLAAGRPMVAMPIAFDQPAVAARIERAGVGEVVRPRFASVRRLARAMEGVLEEPRYTARAREIGREIEAAGGVRRAADLIEARLG